jgi:hypothetical protein
MQNNVRFCLMIKSVLGRFTPSIILLYPPFPILRTISVCLIVLFSYVNMQYFHQFPLLHPLLTIPTPGLILPSCPLCFHKSHIFIMVIIGGFIVEFLYMYLYIYLSIYLYALCPQLVLPLHYKSGSFMEDIPQL